MNTNTPTLDQLKRGLEIAEQIATLEAKLAATLGGKAVPAPAVTAVAPKKAVQTKGRRKFSAQALANIRAAQKKRWAKIDAKPASPEPAKKGKSAPKAVATSGAAQKKGGAKAKSKKAPAKAVSPKVEAKPATSKGPAKKSRKISSAARAKLAAAMKARWATAKKSGGPLPTAKK
jgi:hypothetical protein